MGGFKTWFMNCLQKKSLYLTGTHSLTFISWQYLQYTFWISSITLWYLRYKMETHFEYFSRLNFYLRKNRTVRSLSIRSNTSNAYFAFYLIALLLWYAIWRMEWKDHKQKLRCLENGVEGSQAKITENK